MFQTELENTNIEFMTPTKIPVELKLEIPNNSSDLVIGTRNEIRDILHGRDTNRLLLIVGPCSIHDIEAALEYAKRLAQLKTKLEDDTVVVMRTYFEKPRTTVGWKGLMYQPNLDGKGDISNEGLTLSRQVLADVNFRGLPCSVEFLDTFTPQYIADFISWGAVGARTVESQLHRQLASGLSMTVGFKNSTEGNITVAVDAMQSTAGPHTFPSTDEYARPVIVGTKGNPDTHVILRGGNKGPNYDGGSVAETLRLIDERNLLGPTSRPVMIDASHGNSEKDYRRQPSVIRHVLEQIQNGQKRIMGFMIESNINEGQQKLVPGEALKYGVSITDGCIGWEETEKLLTECARSVRPRIHAVA